MGEILSHDEIFVLTLKLCSIAGVPHLSEVEKISLVVCSAWRANQPRKLLSDCRFSLCTQILSRQKKEIVLYTKRKKKKPHRRGNDAICLSLVGELYCSFFPRACCQHLMVKLHPWEPLSSPLIFHIPIPGCGLLGYSPALQLFQTKTSSFLFHMRFYWDCMNLGSQITNCWTLTYQKTYQDQI